ncbi:hypothetical protein [Streptomyces sp. NPDC047939]|uniref:hypothetical protein n=1 Tax=Streptomyces sp. NPDC047939 TaxID=3155381 RepID=UPI00344AD15F
MDTTRRTILRGMAAAPIVASAGGLLVPGAAMAAPAATMRYRNKVPGGGGKTYADVIRQLRARAERPWDEWHIAKAPVETILERKEEWTGEYADVDWHGKTPPAGELPEFAASFKWRKADFEAGDWRPQGITTNRDAGRLGDKTVLMVSWDARTDRANDQGTRLSIVELQGTEPPRYWNVLLVEPFMNGNHPSYKPIVIHAGGLAWYQGLLYVTDSKSNTLRVFSVADIFNVRYGDGKDPQVSDRFGFAAGSYWARQYAYVMPQTGSYERRPGGLKFSQVSVDRTTSPHTLLVNEFKRAKRKSPQSPMERWALRQDGFLNGTSFETYAVPVGSIQGAASIRNSYYLSTSGGFGNGRLDKWTRDGGVSRLYQVPPGPEDLSYDAGRNALWSLGEYAVGDDEDNTTVNSRYVYAIKL